LEGKRGKVSIPFCYNRTAYLHLPDTSSKEGGGGKSGSATRRLDANRSTWDQNRGFSAQTPKSKGKRSRGQEEKPGPQADAGRGLGGGNGCWENQAQTKVSKKQGRRVYVTGRATVKGGKLARLSKRVEEPRPQIEQT